METDPSQQAPSLASSICQPGLEDVLGADVGHQIWEYLEAVSDHPRLFCTSRKLHHCRQIPQVVQLRYLEERKALESLVIPEEKEGADIQRRHISKMAPYIQSGNYYLARRTQGAAGKTDKVYHSIKGALQDAVKFCLELVDYSGSFQDGWEGLEEGNDFLDGVPCYAEKSDCIRDNPTGWEEYKCVSKFCRHKNNPENLERIYRVDGNDHSQMYCGTCMDNNLYLQLQFAARHSLVDPCIVFWEMSELLADSDMEEDDESEAEEEDIAGVEEPTAKRLIQVNLWEWHSHECHSSRSLWFVGTEATADDQAGMHLTPQQNSSRKRKKSG